MGVNGVNCGIVISASCEQRLHENQMQHLSYNILILFFRIPRFEPIKIYVLSLGSYTRFLCSLIKWFLQQTKITITPILFPPIGWKNWSIRVNVSHLKWRQFSPCNNIHIYFISISITYPKTSRWYVNFL